MKITVVIPCYRSEQTLGPLVDELVEVLPALAGVDGHEVVLVDDGSPDRAGAVVDELAARHPSVRGVHLRRNYGQHNAIVAGIRQASGDLIVTMDDDGQHRPDQIGTLIAPLLEDPLLDLVYGIPSVEEHGPVRSLASRLVKWALRRVGVANAEWVGAFRAFRTDLRAAFVAALGAEVNVDVVLSWGTNRVAAARVVMDRRTVGRSNYSFARLASHAFTMVTGYTALPLRLASIVGFLAAAIGIALSVIVVVQYSVGATTVAGFTSTIAAISLFSGAQLFSIGMIGEYLGRQHFRAMHKPMYLIRTDPDAHDDVA